MVERLLLRGGDVATPEGVAQQDILIENERIVAVGRGLSDRAAEQLDVGGLTILPGLVDVHVHLREPGGEHKEDFHSGTCAALAGGITTVLAMPNTDPPITDRYSLNETLALAASKAVCDYGLYVGATPDNATEVALLDEAIGLKMYIGSSTGSLLVDQVAAQIAHFEGYPKDRVLAVHAEDEAAVQYYAARGQHRPAICAALGTAHALTLAEQFGRHLHICHVSTGYELRLIGAAKQRGAAVTCEVTPHHLFLTDIDWDRLGPFGKVNPPLRPAKEVAALWDQIEVVDAIATDHAPHTIEEKRSSRPPSGMPGLETSLPLLLSAVQQGRLSLCDIARLAAARPAEIFGLSNKGRIAVGRHADLVLVDLGQSWTAQNERLYTRCTWTPFAGWTMQGRVIRVYLRGRVVFSEDGILVEAGYGQRVAQSRNG